MLHPFIVPRGAGDFVSDYFKGIEPGGVFIFPGTIAETKNCAMLVQKNVVVPAIISSDLENGAGRLISDATQFPELMALAATRNTEYAYQMGRAAALEGRSFGIYWSFAPVVDINANPHNPITNTRSIGDNPEMISTLAVRIIHGMQENGLCATAKHFPGDGFDDRDQHICTTINPLRIDQWFRLSGRMFIDAINAGVWSIMVGHIALPAWDPGDGPNIESAPPATLSRKIVTELLREKLGFCGVIITDAMLMGGVTSWGSRERIVLGVLDAGCDMILFANLQRDFEIIKQAIEQGHLTKERIDKSVRRILRLKELVGLNTEAGPRPLSEEDRKALATTSRNIAEEALTLVVEKPGTLPLQLSSQTNILSYHLRADKAYNVDHFDELLRERGAKVTRFTEENSNKLPSDSDILNFDAVLVHLVFGPSWMTNRIRPNGNYMRDLVRIIGLHHPKCVFISYGSPYHLYDLPETPVLINAYSKDKNTQSAVFRFLLSEIQAKGRSPVDLSTPHRVRSAKLL